MKRSGFKRKSYDEILEAKQASDSRRRARTLLGGNSLRRDSKRSREPLRAKKPIHRVGPRSLEWQRAWRFLKPRFEAAGRTSCEFDWPEVSHECFGPLDPAHSKKRREMQGDDIYAVAISCRNFHAYLDNVCTHERMCELVMEAINRHGGLILPEG